MGKSDSIFGRRVVLGGVAIAVVAMLLNSNMWQGRVSTARKKSQKLQRCELKRVTKIV